jgi:hypothetical protein
MALSVKAPEILGIAQSQPLATEHADRAEEAQLVSQTPSPR